MLLQSTLLDQGIDLVSVRGNVVSLNAYDIDKMRKSCTVKPAYVVTSIKQSPVTFKRSSFPCHVIETFI